jgi:hypothetical protein
VLGLIHTEMKGVRMVGSVQRAAMSRKSDDRRTVERIVFLGTFGPPSLTFARSCKAMGIAVYLLTPGASGDARALRSSSFAGAEALDSEGPRGIDAIVAYIRRVGADALATMSEVNCLWLAHNSASFEGVCKLLVPPIECLELLDSKIRQIALAGAAGFQILPTHVIRGISDVAGIEPEHYPICLRPAVRNAVEPAFKVLKADSADDLRHYIQDRWTLRDAIIAQPFRVMPNLIVHCSSREGGELMNARAFLVDRKFEGLALRIRAVELPDGLAGPISKFSKSAGLSGAYHFDMLCDAQCKEAYFLEVNARFGGTTDKVLWLGVDEPADCLEAYGLQPSLPRSRFQTRCRAVVNKRATVKHLLTMLRRGPEPWDYPQESRISGAGHSLNDLLWAKDSVWDYRDLKGSLAFHLQ